MGGARAIQKSTYVLICVYVDTCKGKATLAFSKVLNMIHSNCIQRGTNEFQLLIMGRAFDILSSVTVQTFTLSFDMQYVYSL